MPGTSGQRRLHQVFSVSQVAGQQIGSAQQRTAPCTDELTEFGIYPCRVQLTRHRLVAWL
jgi:hypothetical protein